MKEYYTLLRLNRKEYKIINVKEEKGIIEVKLCSKKKKVKCPICNTFTGSVHCHARPIRSKYLDSCGQEVNLIIHKRRFHCYKCNKIFTESFNLTSKNESISNAVKIAIRKNLLDYNLTIDSIAKNNHVSKYIVRKELEELTTLAKINEKITDVIYLILDSKNS